ncbi:energy transducer TonB [Psychrobacter sp. Ps4]|uniref:cell envelope integrity protein TolA n=1 Tax=Psychrobacter sp. Ps4 TaxID=2790958 RepID=UPI001EE0AA98|nr:cell envelope integrity protein TolA [Psychrobacter sp. Ps4]MCG3808430.1 energy transducer TonB [Psychrobacter sp. Ps4]
MHNAPVVYVPTQPEGNGLTLPTLLSVLAHGLVIGILVYTYQHTKTDTVESIETVMVSPEQLAEMQGQILANRAAAASAMQAETSTSSASSTSSSEIFSDSASQPNSQRVPVFTRSNDPASQPMLMSEEQHQRLLEQNQDYERRMAEWAAQLDESVTEEHGQVEQNKKEKLIEEQKQLGDFRHKQNNPPKITRPTVTDKNLKINTGDSGSAGQRYDLEADGNSTTSNGGSGSTSRSTGEFKSAILSKIQSKLDTPIETQGLTTSLSLKLDTKGNVKSAKASGPNAVVNQAVEQAARAASPLPIDLDNPESFANLTINVTIN